MNKYLPYFFAYSLPPFGMEICVCMCVDLCVLLCKENGNLFTFVIHLFACIFKMATQGFKCLRGSHHISKCEWYFGWFGRPVDVGRCFGKSHTWRLWTTES